MQRELDFAKNKRSEKPVSVVPVVLTNSSDPFPTAYGPRNVSILIDLYIDEKKHLFKPHSLEKLLTTIVLSHVAIIN